MKNKFNIILSALVLVISNFGFAFNVLAYTPNDPLFSYQSVLQRINISEAWEITTGSDEIVIAVIDTGIDIDHPDLVNNIWVNSDEVSGDEIDNDKNGYIDDINGWNFIDNNNDVRPNFSSTSDDIVHHGTVVASILAAVGDNEEGIAGITFSSKIMPIKVIGSDGVGDVNNTIRAIDYAIDNGADIINMSFVGHDYHPTFESALRRAREAGIFVVVAAGNDNTNSGGQNLNEEVLYPACIDKNYDDKFVITVSAVDEDGVKASFSNYGSDCVDFSAPGTKLFGALAFQEDNPNYSNSYGGYWTGTSVATPLVSGAIALIKSVNLSMPYGQVLDALIRGVDDVDELNPAHEGQLGHGIINIAESIRLIYREMESYRQSKYIVTGAGMGDKPVVKIFKANGYLVNEFLAFPEEMRAGLEIAIGNVLGGDEDEIIVVPKHGGGPHLRIFDQQGNLLKQFFVYDKDFRGGLNLAVGNLDNRGYDEIVVAPRKNMSPLVRVYSAQGTMLSEFLAYDKNMTGGVSLAIFNQGYWRSGQILTGAGAGGGPQVAIFDMNGTVRRRFFAFLENFRGGINVASGDLTGNMIDEIIVGVASGTSAYVRIFDNNGRLNLQTMAYPDSFLGGVNLAVADLDNDGKSELIFGAGVGGGPHVRIFDNKINLFSQFFAYNKSLRGGVSIDAIRKK